jgi:aldehyde dehydrogenase (NAD+)
MQPQPIKDDVSVVLPAITKARNTFISGKTKSIEYRIAQLKALKNGILKMKQELVDAVKADIGRESFVTWFSEISIIEKEIDHATSNIKNWAKEIAVDTPVFLGPAKSKIVHEPLGVVAIMGSWNFPLYTNFSPLISAIAAGNCAVIKPSEIAPNTLRKIKALIARNLDTSSFVCIEGAVEVAKALSSSKLDSICFTGSSEKGRLVASAAGKNLVPCILELGGKSPAIVDESANLELAARKIVVGKFLNAGQICIAPDYILLSHSVAANFIKIL